MNKEIKRLTNMKILVIGAIIIIAIGFISLIVFAFKNQVKFQEERDKTFWECVDNNKLEWCLKHFH